MTSNDCLYPDSLRAQFDSIKVSLASGNIAMENVKKSLLNLKNEECVKGKSFEALKQHLSDYEYVITVSKSLNENIVHILEKLKADVGDEVINGHEIFEGREKATRLLQEYKNKLETVEERIRSNMFKGNVTDPLISVNQKSDNQIKFEYQCMISNLNEILDEYDRLENRFDLINNKTKSVFDEKKATITIINRAVKEIAKSFNGNNFEIDNNAKWRSDLSAEYQKMYFEFDEKGNIVKINLHMLEKILKKDADEITSEEYGIAAASWLYASPEECSEIVKLLMKNRKDIEGPSLDGLAIVTSPDYSEWQIDEEKCKSILAKLGVLQNVSLRAMKDKETTVLIMSHKKLLQKIALLVEIRKIGKYRGKFKRKNPDVEINKKGESFVLKFKEKHHEFINEYVWEFGTNQSTMKMTEYSHNLYPGEIEIEKINTAEEAALRVGNMSKKELQEEIAGLGYTDIVLSNTSSRYKSDMIGKGAQLLAENISKKGMGMASSSVLLMGDFATDCIIKHQENKKNAKLISDDIDNIVKSSIFDKFDLFLEINWNKRKGKKSFNMIFHKGTKTEQKIRKYNKMVENDKALKKNGYIKLEDFNKNPKEVIKKYQAFIKRYPGGLDSE